MVYITKRYFRSESNEAENSEQLIGNIAEATTLPSNLIMVKTASGKNVILKVMPQSIGDELHVSVNPNYAVL